MVGSHSLNRYTISAGCQISGVMRLVSGVCCQMLAVGCWGLGVGCWVLGFGDWAWVRGVECGGLDFVYRVLGAV